MSETTTKDYDRSARLTFMTAIGVIAPSAFLLAPYISESFAQSFGWTETQRGAVASAELGASALAALSALLWINTSNWRRVFRILLVLLITGNVVSIFLNDFYSILAARSIAGLGAGAMMAIYTTFLSYTRAPDRNASLLMLGQVSLMASGFVLMPLFLQQWGQPGVFGFLTLLCLPLLRLSLIPVGAPAACETANETSEELQSSFLPGLAILAASAMFFVAQLGLWTFFFDIGATHSLTEGQTLRALVVSTVSSVAAPLVGLVLRERLGLRIPLVVPALLQIVILSVLVKGGLSFGGFLIATSLFQFLWVFMLVYTMTALVEADSTHRLVALLPTAQAIGIAIGPILVGSLLQSYGVSAIAWVSSTALILFMALVVPFTGKRYLKSRD